MTSQRSLIDGRVFSPIAMEIVQLAALVRLRLEAGQSPPLSAVAALRLNLDACGAELERLRSILAAAEASNTRNSPDGLS